MLSISDIEALRAEILNEMQSMRAMRRGTITEQFLKVWHKGKEAHVLRGPYYVLSRRDKGRTVSRRLSRGRQLRQARQEVTQYKRFQELCVEFVALTEQLSDLEAGD